MVRALVIVMTILFVIHSKQANAGNKEYKEISQEGKDKKETSSYDLLKTKYALCMVELEDVKNLVQQLRMELEDNIKKRACIGCE
jgi:hypothetical protein